MMAKISELVRLQWPYDEFSGEKCEIDFFLFFFPFIGFADNRRMLTIHLKITTS